MTATNEAAAPVSVSTSAEAELLITHLLDVMDTLLATVEQETELVRAGRLTEAARLETSKAELSRLYMADIQRLKNSNAYIKTTMPDVFDALHKRHDLFRALLQMNLTVLATAHAVSEGIMRGVSSEINRKAAPQVYGASGRHSTPHPVHAQPLALSRAI
jgi:hypothetical protein